MSLEDSIFDPWSAAREPPRAVAGEPAHEEQRVPAVSAPPDLLRGVALSRMKAVAHQLSAARHHVSVEDLLDQPPHVLRFRLRPWAGPFSEGATDRWAMLEIGLGGEAEEHVTAWSWLGDTREAPDEARTLPSGKLTAGWVERVVLDFVGKVLGRS